MKVLLINIDSVIPNLALKKIEKFHLDRGDEVIWDNELMRYSVDEIYVSCVFTKNQAMCKEWEGSAMIGGSGYDMNVKLPADIEAVKPRINWGFTTRGCIRNCHFCFVPKMEGAIRIVGDIYDLWDGQAKQINIMDNNFLAAPFHHVGKIIDQLRNENLKVDFNQGLDIRLLYRRNLLSSELRGLRHVEYRYAWDAPDVLMPKRLEWVMDHVGRASIYVLAGFTTFEEVLSRLEIIKSIGHRAYLMRHESVAGDRRYTQLARWANQRHMFAKQTFEQFDKSNSEAGEKKGREE